MATSFILQRLQQLPHPVLDTQGVEQVASNLSEVRLSRVSERATVGGGGAGACDAAAAVQTVGFSLLSAPCFAQLTTQ